MSTLRDCCLIALCVVLAGCSLNQTREEMASSSELSVLEREVHELVNRYRISHNLPPLEFNDTIAHHARVHSQNMADEKVAFGHDGFDDRVRVISEFLPYSSVAENVAFNNREYWESAPFAVDGWIGSPGHLDHIEGDFRLTGVGIAVDSAGTYYFTQLFWK